MTNNVEREPRVLSPELFVKGIGDSVVAFVESGGTTSVADLAHFHAYSKEETAERNELVSRLSDEFSIDLDGRLDASLDPWIAKSNGLLVITPDIKVRLKIDNPDETEIVDGGMERAALLHADDNNRGYFMRELVFNANLSSTGLQTVRLIKFGFTILDLTRNITPTAK